MSFWNFWRKNRSPLNPEQLQAVLMECPLSISRLTRFAHRHRSELVEHAQTICRIPDGIRSNPELANSYVQKLGFVAEFLAKECDSPALWERLVGNDSSNPTLKWTRWYESLPAREQNLEYPALIQEAREYISEAEKLRGTAPTIHLAYLNAHLAALLFNSSHPDLTRQEALRRERRRAFLLWGKELRRRVGSSKRRFQGFDVSWRSRR